MPIPPSNKIVGDIGHTTDHNSITTELTATNVRVTAVEGIANTEAIQDLVGGMVTGNSETGITVAYDDTGGKLNFTVSGGGGGGSTGPVIEAVDYGVSSGNAATVNGAAMRAIMDTYAGRHIRMPIGVIEIDSVLGSGYGANPLVGGNYAAFWMSSGTWLEIPTGCEIRFMGASSTLGTCGLVADSSQGHRLISNQNMDPGTDRDIRVFGGGTINGNLTALLVGNAGGQGKGFFQGTSDSNRKITGLTFWRASNIIVEGITIKDFHGENGSNGENFYSDFIRCLNVRIQNVTCTNSSAVVSTSATAFSNTHCMNLHYQGCKAEGLQVQGFTSYGSRHVTFEQCWATRNKRGFNFEYCWDVTMTDCVGGGVGPRHPGSTASSSSGNLDMDDGDLTFGNTEAGYHIIFGDGGTSGKGGGRYRFVNCHASGQSGTNARGFAFGSTHEFATTTGTTGASVVATNSGSVARSMIGGFLQLVSTGANGGTSRLHRITGVSGSTVTVTPNHSGSTGMTAVYYPGSITIDGCLISENFRGIQFLGAPGAGVQGISRSLEIINTEFVGNTDADIQDHAKSDSLTGTIARFKPGVNVSANVTYALDGSAFMNPFPFPVEAFINTATSIQVGDRYSDPVAGLVDIPIAPGGGGGGTVTIARVDDSGLLVGTTPAADSQLSSTLTIPGVTGCDFLIEGFIIYTTNSTSTDAQFQLRATPSVTSNMNQTTRHRYHALTSGDSAGPTVFSILDHQLSSSGTATLSSPASVLPVGGLGSTRAVYEFRQMLTVNGVSGGKTATWELLAAENVAGTGVNIRTGSNIRITPLNGPGSASGGAGVSPTVTRVRIPAGGWIKANATSATWIAV